MSHFLLEGERENIVAHADDEKRIRDLVRLPKEEEGLFKRCNSFKRVGSSLGRPIRRLAADVFMANVMSFVAVITTKQN